MAWDLADVKSSEIAVDLRQHACLKERYHCPSGFGSLHASTIPKSSTRAKVMQCAGRRWKHG